MESFAEVLLRTGKLAEAKNKGEEVFPTTEGKREGSSSLTVCNSRCTLLTNNVRMNKSLEKTFFSNFELHNLTHHSFIHPFINFV